MCKGKWIVKVIAGRWMAGINRFATRKAAEAFRDAWLKAEGLAAASDGIITLFREEKVV